MCDSVLCEDKPPAPPVRMSSQGGGPKDSQSANHSSRPLPSVPEERKSKNKIISIFASEKGVSSDAPLKHALQWQTNTLTFDLTSCRRQEERPRQGQAGDLVPV